MQKIEDKVGWALGIYFHKRDIIYDYSNIPFGVVWETNFYCFLNLSVQWNKYILDSFLAISI